MEQAAGIAGGLLVRELKAKLACSNKGNVVFYSERERRGLKRPTVIGHFDQLAVNQFCPSVCLGLGTA